VALPAAGAAAANGDESADVWGVRLKRAALTDARTGLPVFEWLIPAEWQFDGSVTWRNSVAVPALLSFRAWHPGGPEQIECLPAIPNTWTKNVVSKVMSRLGVRPLALKFDGLEQRQPMSARDALHDLVVPRYRGLSASHRTGRLRGGLLGFLDPELVDKRIHQVPGLSEALAHLRKLKTHGYASPDVVIDIVEDESMPHLAASLRGDAGQPDTAPPSDGARVRIRYTLDGIEMEEDIFCVVSSARTRTGVGPLAEEQIHWVAESLFAFRAERGHLDALARGCMASVRSLRMNPQWYAAYQAESQRIMQERIAMQQALRQMAAVQRASFQRQMHRLGDISRTLSDTSDIIMSGYETRSAAFDRASQGWSEAMRGVDSYVDPIGGRSVELPGGFEHAWTNGLGEYVLTDSAFLQPGQFAPGNWEAMRRG
jgi:hypothetical protein